jgi:hypothetical protein
VNKWLNNSELHSSFCMKKAFRENEIEKKAYSPLPPTEQVLGD